MKKINGLFIGMLVMILAGCSQQAATVNLEMQLSQWWVLGSRLNQTTLPGEPSLALRANDRPVAAFGEFIENDGNIVVKVWSGTAWISLNFPSDTRNSFTPVIATRSKHSFGAPLYDPIGVAWNSVTYGQSDYDINVALRLGNTWVKLGNAVDVKPENIAQLPSIALDKLGLPIVAWFEFDATNPTGGYFIYVKRWNGQRWVQLGSSLCGDGFPRAGLDLAIDNSGYPFIAHTCIEPVSAVQKVFVKRWNGTQWIQLGSFLGTDQALKPTLAVGSDGFPVVAWRENASRIYASRWNGSKWINLGDVININEGSYATYPAVALDNTNKPVIVFDENGQINVRRWTGNKWETTGLGLNNTNANGGEKLDIVVDSKNKAIVGWAEFSDMGGNIYVKQQK